MQKLEPWLVNKVIVKGGVDIVSIIAKGLPVWEDLDLVAGAENLKAPSLAKKRLVLLIGVFSAGNNFERRMALRRTWMQYDAVRSGAVAVRFFIGLVSDQPVTLLFIHHDSLDKLVSTLLLGQHLIYIRSLSLFTRPSVIVLLFHYLAV